MASKLKKYIPTSDGESTEVLPKVDEITNTQCGFTENCTPIWLQKCANPKAYLAVITIFGIVQGFAINGINSVNLSMYERRYLLSSKSSSLVSAFYDISAGILVPVIGYYGATTHQPRMLATSFVSMGFGTLIMSMAHFTAPAYNPGNVAGSSILCNLNNTSTLDDLDSQAYLKNYIYVLLLGQLLNGYAGACLYTIGVTYLDQSCTMKDAALYIGIFSGGTVFGPAIGFLVGGSLLDVYVDFPATPPKGLSVEHPAWVGAWWLAFVISSALCFILALFMFLFPRELPGTAEIRAAKISQAHDNGLQDRVNVTGFGIGWRDLPKATWYLLRNSCYVCICIVNGLEFAIIIGISAFLPKLISNQFAQSLKWSSILTGILAVPAAAVAQVLGGVIIQRFSLNLSQLLKFVLASSILALLLSPVYLARCSDGQMAGITTGYPGVPDFLDVNLTSPCNTGCGCSTGVYDPVCADGVQYFSPCHAGCPQQSIIDENEDKVYYQCSCTVGQSQMMFKSNETDFIPTVNKKCDLNCKLLYYVFTPFGLLQFFFSFFAGTPLTIATLRVVPDKLRTYGVAISWIFLRFLGSIPGPIVFGAMIDASCLIWQNDAGGEGKGSCWIYDNAEMSKRTLILVAVVKCLSILFTCIALKLYKAPNVNNEDENPTEVELK